MGDSLTANIFKRLLKKDLIIKALISNFSITAQTFYDLRLLRLLKKDFNKNVNELFYFGVNLLRIIKYRLQTT
jgi:hypothetical protein